jgi:hypothetical protein
MRPATATIGSLYGDGSPILRSGAIDYGVLGLYGVHDYFIQYADPPVQVLEALAQHYPSCRPIAKVTLAYMTKKTNALNFSGALWLHCDRRGGFFGMPPGAVNLTVPGLVDEIIDLITARIIRAPYWAGLHIEALLGSPLSPQSSWDLALKRLWTLLRERVPTSWRLWWNGGQPSLPDWSGCMWENWPFQGGSGGPAGAFDSLRVWPQACPIIFTGEPSTSLAAQKHDYGRACAWMLSKDGDGVHIFAPLEPMGQLPKPPPKFDLGAPLGPAYLQHGLWRRDGELGSVVIDPSYPSNIGNPPARGRAWIIT